MTPARLLSAGGSLALVCSLAIVAPPAARAGTPGDAAAVTLEARAVLPADATAPGPWAAASNAEPDLSAPGGAQPVGGFSALVEDRHGRLWAMPDNGFGSKANSRSFLLRVYQVTPAWETARGGPGTVALRSSITLSDPGHRIPWPIVAQGSKARLLTGGDFDIESVRPAPDGTWWFGEEFGPFLLHTDARGRLLEAPIPTPGVSSPDNPLLAPGVTPNLARSNGFEATALTSDGRRLMPVLEGPLTGQDPLERTVFEYDLRARSWTGRFWTYPMTVEGTLVSDMTALDAHRFVVLERDNGQGTAAAWKRAFVIDLREADASGRLVKHQIADLLSIHDPAAISLPAREGDLGLGTAFSMPYVTIEAVLPLEVTRHGARLAIVNDTNFGSTGRNPGLPDDSDFIVIKVRF
jgi:glycerophosphoryl diester phosphodiesterase